MESETRTEVQKHLSKASITSTDSFVIVDGAVSNDGEEETQAKPPQGRISLLRGPDWPEVIPSIWEDFIKRSQDCADRVAIAAIYQKGERLGLKNTPSDHPSYESDPYVRWTYSELAKGVALLISALEKLEIKTGSTILVLANNCAEIPLLFWAGTFLGCDYIPIHPRNLLNTAEITHLLSTVAKSGTQGKTLVFAQDDETANKVRQLNVVEAKDLIVIEDDKSAGEFQSMRSLMQVDQDAPQVDLSRYVESSTQCGVTIFTSGTTALPKGVRGDASKVNKWILMRHSMQPLHREHSCFFMLPVNHVYYLLVECAFRAVGAATVLPGPGFTPQAMPDLIAVENCTHFPTSPTMVYGLAQVARDRNCKFGQIESISCGGSNLGIDVVTNILDVIGAQAIEVMYGQTEMNLITSTGSARECGQVVKDGRVLVGQPMYGITLKVCAPDSTEILPINTEGELHVATSCLCDGYLGGDKPPTFYTDEHGVRWLSTGDAGTVDENGMVFISGRIKDMIIRGGVNISPAAIELLLANGPSTARFLTQIVGRMDKIAGEIPIAVVKGPMTKEEAKELQQYVLSNMGSIYVPEEVLTLEYLGLDAFPATMLGKVQKTKLRELVNTLPVGLENSGAEQPVDEIALKVKKAWSRIMGHDVDLITPITAFADSIHIMRVRDRFAKEVGVNVTLAEMLQESTIAGQIELVRTKLEAGTHAVAAVPQVRDATEKSQLLSHLDIVHLRSKPKLFPQVQQYIEKRIGACGLDWADVQAITPGSDMTSVLMQADILNTSWSWKQALLAKEGMTKASLRTALEVLLKNNPLLVSMYMWNRPAFESDDAVHVMFHPTQKLFDKMIHDYGSIANKADFAADVFKPYEYQMSLVTGLLTNFLLFDIADTGRCGVIMVFHHVHTDGSYMPKMLEDFDQAISGEALKPHVSYKTWADSYYALRSTPLALEHVSWHTARLADLVSMREATYPQLPRPHHYTSEMLHMQTVDDNGYHFDFKAKGMNNLRQKHSKLNPPTIIKAAWTLLNILRNQTSTAVFSQTQADRRQFPFIPQALIDLAPPETYSAADVAGCTLQDIVNIISLEPEETILDFMHRVMQDQEEINVHAAAPLRHIFAEIGATNAEIMLDILRSQIFNWTPGLSSLEISNPYDNIEPVSLFIRPSIRLVINVDVGGKDHETVYAQIKSPLFDKRGLRSLARDFEDLVLWLCNEENWMSHATQFRDAMRPAVDGQEDLSDVKESYHII